MARSGFRWHQNGNVFWADFRPNYRNANPPPSVDPGNTAPAPECSSDERASVVSRLERRIDSVLLDLLQGQQQVIAALREEVGHLIATRGQITQGLVELIQAEMEALRTELNEHKAGVLARGVEYRREFHSIREQIAACAPSRQEVLTFSLRSMEPERP